MNALATVNPFIAFRC